MQKLSFLALVLPQKNKYKGWKQNFVLINFQHTKVTVLLKFQSNKITTPPPPQKKIRSLIYYAWRHYKILFIKI